MTDRELLETAAKAAGVDLHRWDAKNSGFLIPGPRLWNPLLSDGDALRLAVSLRLSLAVKTLPHAVYVEAGNGIAASAIETLADTRFSVPDEAAATRRAIVCAAAAMAASK